MKQTNRIPKTSRVSHSHAASSIPDFEHLADVATAQVEHRTVLQFLRTIPHKWHPDEMARFGDKVRRMAEALQLAFVPAMNDHLGVIRAYPVPLMQWMYTQLATQFGWPLGPLALDDGAQMQREELRRAEGAKKHLEAAAAQHAPPTPEVAGALETVLAWLESETRRLRGGDTPPSPVPPLRAI